MFLVSVLMWFFSREIGQRERKGGMKEEREKDLFLYFKESMQAIAEA